MLSKPTVSEIEDESEASPDREQTTVDAGTQTVNSDFKVKIQTRAATQTDEFEYLSVQGDSRSAFYRKVLC